MKLTLFIQDDCSACSRTESQIREVISERENINFVVKNLNDENLHNICIVPALFIEDKLYSYGEIDKEKLNSKIDNLLQT